MAHVKMDIYASGSCELGSIQISRCGNGGAKHTETVSLSKKTDTNRSSMITLLESEIEMTRNVLIFRLSSSRDWSFLWSLSCSLCFLYCTSYPYRLVVSIAQQTHSTVAVLPSADSEQSLGADSGMPYNTGWLSRHYRSWFCRFPLPDHWAIVWGFTGAFKRCVSWQIRAWIMQNTEWDNKLS